ncbi:hypothetical protein [Burkholderia vietnamiensis]|uniref:hypothetical protein n=1 Tax=Burkholderia vietnamiensis TaxID=60552 RepID=UPI00159399E1|nr:hypothetical protein [Burkholderia vietnamiensis]
MKITDDMLTEWFPEETHPSHDGVYEVKNIVGTETRFFSHWNRDGWSTCMWTPDDAACVAQERRYRTEYRSWRGLKKSPRDTLIEEIAEMVDHMGEGRRLEEYVGAIREMKSGDKGGV